MDDLDKMLERKPRRKEEDFSELEALDPAFRRPLPVFEKNEPISPVAQAMLPESYQMVRKALFGEGEIPKGYGELAGLGAGAVAGTLEQGRNVLNLLPFMRAASESVPSPADSAYEKWLRNYAGMERTGPGGVPQAAQTYQRAKTHGEAGKKMFQRYGNQPLDILRYSQQAEDVDRAKRLAGLSQAAQQTSRGLGYIPGLSLLAGTAGGADLVEAMRRLERGDIPGAAIKGIGGLGALASLIPHPITRLGGGALGLLSLPLEAIYSGITSPTESPQYQAP